jgi:hypothetical protein
MKKEAYIREPDLSSWFLKPEHINILNKSESTVYIIKHNKEKDDYLKLFKKLRGLSPRVNYTD